MVEPLESHGSTTVTSDSEVKVVETPKADSALSPNIIVERPIVTGYVSNLDNEFKSEEDEPANTLDEDGLHVEGLTICVSEAPPLKHRQYEIPVCLAKKQAQDKKAMGQ